MKNKVQILSIKQNKIICRIRKRKIKILMPMCLMLVIGFVTFFSIGGSSIGQISNNMCYIYNPVNSLYSDNSNIIFTSVNVLNKENLDFVIPITGSETTIESNGNILFTVYNSIMVKSIESGVVEEVGTTLNGIKYIKILHCLDVYSIIENVNIIGVTEGDVIKKGQDIATAKEGSVVTLKIFNSDNQVTNIKLNQSKIICEN